MSNDKELLELAAKAAGLNLVSEGRIAWENKDDNGWLTGGERAWNPLTDDGDALRLAVQLGITIDMVDQAAWKLINAGSTLIQEYWGGDYDPCYRRAVVRAAAEIGKAMK